MKSFNLASLTKSENFYHCEYWVYIQILLSTPFPTFDVSVIDKKYFSAIYIR